MKKQEIKITVSNKENKIGTFIISTKNEELDGEEEDYSFEDLYYDPNNNKIKISLKNVNIVDEIDSSNPIEYCKKNKNVKIFLLEEKEYDIHFESENKDLKVFKELLSHNNDKFYKKSTNYDGFLRAKSYVGKTFLDIEDYNFKIPIEIKSKKIDYDSDYRNMIGDLAQLTTGLLFNTNAPLFQSYEKSRVKKETSYETFLLIEYLFKDKNLPSIFEYLSRNLYSQLETFNDEVPISFAKDIGRDELVDIITNPQDLILSNEYSFFKKNNNSFVPLIVNERKHEETIDIPENRFYKYFLEYIEDVINKLLKIIEEENKANSYMFEELENYKSQINYFLSQKYFKDISKMDFAPLNSQVLQKKEGYREILEYYILFDYGLNLSWDDLLDEFKTYQKKLSKLYEYWTYFELLELLKNYTNSAINTENIINKENWSFNLKEGETTCIKFDNVTISEESIGMTLFFNKKFKKADIEEDENNNLKILRGDESYSVELKPDYTLEIEINNTKYYLHFDAKYKSKIIDVSTKSFQNQDIEKMHTYKDGITNSFGSFVLYPGNDESIIFSDYSKYKHFGVGAIPLNPSNTRENEGKIIDLIEKYITNLIELDKELKND